MAPVDSAFGVISRANVFENEALPPALHLGLVPVQGRGSGWGLGWDSAS